MAERVIGEGPADEAPTARRRWFRRPRRLHRPRPPLAALIVVTAAVYAAYSLMRLRAFRTTSYDLVIFDQGVRSYSGFGLPVAMVKGVHNGFGPGFPILGDHFSPALALLAPLYWIHDGPATLLIAQAALFALAIVPIWRYTERRLGAGAAYCAAGAYALSWPVAEALSFDFHEVAFVPLLSALLVERYDAGRRGQAAVAAVALLLVKEDMGLLLAGFGLFLLARRPRGAGGVRAWPLRGDRPAGFACLAAGLVATWVCSRLIIAAFGGDNDYYWAYGSLGPDLPSAAAHALTRPWDVVATLTTPPGKLATMALLVLPLLLLPLASPLTLTVLPLLAERMLASRFSNWWAPSYHYNAFLIAVLVLAAVDGAVRVRGLIVSRARRRTGEQARRSRASRQAVPGSRPRRHRLPAPRVAPAAGMLTAGIVLVPFFAFNDLADPALWKQNQRARAAAAVAARVPDGVLVESANGVGPALTGRTRVLLWDWEPRYAPWVVADVDRLEFPFTSVDEQRARVETLIEAGYREVFRRYGYVLLHRDAPDPW
ncbi:MULTISPECIES: DUF2079 domain-containing protein [Thermomonosporaceae]|uniref:DUF2079 domain-containing protein n=1 Tax=Thermomonosporaceae TaxID=2012 RepID=UPI00255ACC45|nr:MULTISPECIES: DUF2079 domain-containing protein [Thermomonosporaceae]MDL4771744.1 DUF2079 domain-containing protein [Actinomadura xylanilytica]